MQTPETYVLILRLVLAGILGGLIGAEREYRAKTAGTRTHILVAIGAALMLIVSRCGFDGQGDPARVAAQIVSGIGFLGAGAIIVERHSVHGLTTAAGIWVSAGIGMAVASGLYAVSIAATILSLIGLEVLGWFSRNGKRNEKHGMNTRMKWGLALVAICCGATEVKGGVVAASGKSDEYLVPVRPVGVNGQPAWNVAAKQFTYAPAFGFDAVPKAVRYRFDVTAEAEGAAKPCGTFEADRPTAAITPVWAAVPVGYVTVKVTGVAADGKDAGVAGTRRFWKMPPFREGAYPKAVRGYRETAEMIWKYVFNRPYLQYMLDKGEPDPTYPLNSYPAKMLASQIWAMLRYAKLSPADAPRAMKIARLAADRLIAKAEPARSPLAFFPQTYDGRGEAGNGYLGEKFRGQHMLHYPAAAGEALLDFAAASGEKKYRDFALKIADTYARLQEKDGTWPLKMDAKTGKSVCGNRLVPIRVMTFLERVAKLTGDAKCAQASARAFAFIENGPLRDWNWEGQFEDIYPAPLYANLTKHGACDVALYLLKRFPGDARRLSQARELLRWSEDQFMVWDGRYFQNNGKWTTPVALEQYHCYAPIDESAAKMMMTYLALYRVEKNPRDLAKARAIGDAFTRVTLEDRCLNGKPILGSVVSNASNLNRNRPFQPHGPIL